VTGGTVPGSDWFQDDTELLQTLKGGQAPARGKPTIAGYAELHEISRGGQGVVYRAVQVAAKRKVAIKVLLDSEWASPAARRRFEREVEVVAHLQHPNIVRLYDTGVTDTGYPYYVMEFIEGGGLDEYIGGDGGGDAWSGLAEERTLDVRDAPRLRRERPPVRGALQLFAKICEAVHYAHQRGVIHRDLKPTNILIDLDGEPHVLDFGLAKAGQNLFIDTPYSAVSRTGEFVGTPPWACPEQAGGNPAGMDVRSDVYALGVMLFQILTGRFPYPVVGGLEEVLTNIQTLPPELPSRHRREVDGEIDTIVLTCLAKAPDERYQNAGDLARDIRRWLAGEPIEARRAGSLYALRKTLRRYRTLMRLSSAAVVLLLAVAVLAAFAQESARQRREAMHSKLADAEARADEKSSAVAQVSAQLAQRRTVERFLRRALSQGFGANAADVAALLDRAAEALNDDRKIGGEERLALHATLASAYGRIAAHDRARQHLAEARRLLANLKPTTDPDATWTRYALARVALRYGDVELAAGLLPRTYERLCLVHAADHPEAIACLDALVDLHVARGAYETAADRALEHFDRVQRVLGVFSDQAEAALPRLAELLIATGRYGENVTLAEQRRDETRRVYGDNHPATLDAETAVIVALTQAGLYPAATERLGKAVARAADLPRAAADVRLRLELARADLLLRHGELSDAERHLRGALPQRSAAALDGASPTELRARCYWADCRLLLGEAKAARDVTLDVLNSARCERDRGGCTARRARQVVIAALIASDNPKLWDVAAELIDEELQLCAQTPGVPLRAELETRLLAGRLQVARLAGADESTPEQLAAARAVVEQLAALRDRIAHVRWRHDPLLAEAKATLGAAQAALGDLAEAETQLRAGYEELCAAFLGAHPRTRQIATELADVLEAAGRADEASQYRQRLSAGGT
jgi:hypothetical protein